MTSERQRRADDLGLFLFDIGGTVLDEGGLVLSAYVSVIEKAGLRADPEWFGTRRGMNKTAMLREALEAQGGDPRRAPELAAEFAVFIDHELETHPVSAFPGFDALERGLTEHDVQVGFITGFAGRTARAIVDRMGWHADAIVGSDEVAEGRPAPDLIYEAMQRTGVSDARRVGVCGDTPFDIDSGRAAGCGLVVAIGHGTHDAAELAVHEPDLVVADFTELARRLGLSGPTETPTDR